MKRFILLALSGTVLLAACADTVTIPVPEGGANLASVHLKGGKNAKPSFEDLILQLRAFGTLSGLGNGDVFVGLTATADASAVCINPGTGAHQPPGQNPAPVQVTGGQAIPAEEIKNGNTPFNVTTEIPPEAGPRPAVPGTECPNVQWTYQVTDLAFTSAIISVFQPSTGDPQNPGTLVLRVSCTFNPKTANGAVPAANVTCTQTQF